MPVNDEISVEGDESDAKMPAVEVPHQPSQAQPFSSSQEAANQQALAALLSAQPPVPFPGNLLAFPTAAGANLSGTAPAGLHAGDANFAFYNPQAAVGASLPGIMIPPNLLALMLPRNASNPLASSLPIMALLANNSAQALAQQQQQQLQSLAGWQQLAVSNAAQLGNANVAPQAPQIPLPLTNRPPVPLFLDYDEQTLNAYQCILRKQIELFETTEDDLKGSSQGRNTPIALGQVAVRCRHCSRLPKSMRPKGSQYYSRTLEGVYQVCQNMFKAHFEQKCSQIPEETKQQLIRLQQSCKRASSGKQFWVEGLRVHGVYEDGRGLRFRPLRPGGGGI